MEQGFRKTEQELWQFSNPWFVRGKRELLSQIVRQRSCPSRIRGDPRQGDPLSNKRKARSQLPLGAWTVSRTPDAFDKNTSQRDWSRRWF